MASIFPSGPFSRLSLLLLAVLASISLTFGVFAIVDEVRDYRAMKAEHLIMLQWFGETIATQAAKDGKQDPVNRPMVIDALIRKALAPKTTAQVQ